MLWLSGRLVVSSRYWSANCTAENISKIWFLQMCYTDKTGKNMPSLSSGVRGQWHPLTPVCEFYACWVYVCWVHDFFMISLTAASWHWGIEYSISIAHSIGKDKVCVRKRDLQCAGMFISPWNWEPKLLSFLCSLIGVERWVRSFGWVSRNWWETEQEHKPIIIIVQLNKLTW